MEPRVMQLVLGCRVFTEIVTCKGVWGQDATHHSMEKSSNTSLLQGKLVGAIVDLGARE